MDEWQAIIIDTYKKLSKETGMKKAYAGAQPNSNQLPLSASSG